MTESKTASILVADTGRVEAIQEAVAEVVEAHRAEILVAPNLVTVTLIVRLDRGATPSVLFRTESR